MTITSLLVALSVLAICLSIVGQYDMRELVRCHYSGTVSFPTTTASDINNTNVDVPFNMTRLTIHSNCAVPIEWLSVDGVHYNYNDTWYTGTNYWIIDPILYYLSGVVMLTIIGLSAFVVIRHLIN